MLLSFSSLYLGITTYLVECVIERGPSLAAKEWITRAPAVVNSSLSAHEQSDSDVHDRPSNRLLGESTGYLSGHLLRVAGAQASAFPVPVDTEWRRAGLSRRCHTVRRSDIPFAQLITREFEWHSLRSTRGVP
jgi:hypothetical protein